MSSADRPRPDGTFAQDPLAGTADEFEVVPVHGPLDATVRPPGSKSITNRALICAALASGRTELRGVLFADDTEAMLDCLRGLGIRMEIDRDANTVRVTGCRGLPPAEGAVLDARLSGTTARFVTPVAALGGSTVVIDGGPPLRARPMGDLLDALVEIGAQIEPLGESGHLPVQIEARGLLGGEISVRGDVSSQFLSAVLLSAPDMVEGLSVSVTTPLVSRPYVDMTLEVMAEFGAHTSSDPGGRIAVAPTGYRAVAQYSIEPDASAASYFFAAAVICGGRVRVEGFGPRSMQGDLRFVDVLERMGARVTRTAEGIEVSGGGELHGIEIDMGEISDTAQTLAVVAPFASSPTRVTGIGFIRRKETDRIAAVVTELRRLGIDATEEDDGFVVNPGTPMPALVQTYDDHRMAMSFALIGLRSPGVRIADPGCVAKTFPGFWSALDSLRPGPRR